MVPAPVLTSPAPPARRPPLHIYSLHYKPVCDISGPSNDRRLPVPHTQNERLHALDAVRALALLLGIVLHASMSFLPGPQIWASQDVAGGEGFSFAFQRPASGLFLKTLDMLLGFRIVIFGTIWLPLCTCILILRSFVYLYKYYLALIVRRV